MYFVQFAQDYLSASPSFDAHPPLGKYWIAAGIWLHHWLPSRALGASLPAVASAAVGYRWMNALAGSCVPLVVMGLAHTVCKQSIAATSIAQPAAKSTDIPAAKPATENAFTTSQANRLKTFTLLSGAFVAIDGLFVVESRYGLINIYMVLLGLLGLWLWLRREETTDTQTRNRLGVLAGVCLGGAIATKWNGLGFVLSLLLWDLFRTGAHWRNKAYWENRAYWKNRTRWEKRDIWATKERVSFSTALLRKAALTRLIPFLFYVGLISSVTYTLAWLPHLWLTQNSFFAVHSSLLSFHQQLPSDGHSACSQWFTWPLLIKPIAYWYEVKNGAAYTVNNMGNPVLWWLSSAAILLMVLDKITALARTISKGVYAWATPKQTLTPTAAPAPLIANSIITFCLIGYGANWLPWLLVQRCTFIYLYMPAAVFSFMGLAWVISGWLHSRISWVRLMGWVMIVAIALAFIFWLPLSIGSPLSTESLQIRWWLKSWI